MRNARSVAKGNWLAAAGLILILAISACAPAAPGGDTNAGSPTDAVEGPTATPALPETGAITPSVTVSDQEIVDGMVTVAEVVSAGPGWIVIHADNEGAPGPVIGHSAVSEGSNMDVMVEIDPTQATETLYAMLHTDAGVMGEYEFPGADGPVSVDGQVVTPPFMVTNLGEQGGEAGAITPSVTVSDQEIVDGMVTVAEVVSTGPGWIVIHADNQGAPGPVIGHAAVSEGSNMDVMVEIDPTQATETLYAMLHTDAGAVGEYEFPGADGPVSVDGQVITPPFMVTNLGEAGAAGMVEVVMQNDTFSPATITVSAGTTVVWTHQDGSEPHTVTADDGAFTSGDLNLGDTFEFTFDTPGTYAYYCEHHGGPGGVGMSGVVEVQ